MLLYKQNMRNAQAQWFVIQSKPCQELQNQGCELFLPKIEIKKIVGRERIQKVEPLFSSYLFVQLSEADSNWFPLRSTRGVSGLVRFESVVPGLPLKTS
jgi:transcriptional antiterminator RfaH